MSNFLFLKTSSIHHALNPKLSWGSKFFLAEDGSCCYLPPRGYAANPKPYSWEHGDLALQAYKTNLDKEGGACTLALSQEAGMQRHGLECQNHIQQAFGHTGLPPLGLIHLGQACGLLIAFPPFNPLPPSSPTSPLSLNAFSRSTP